jgi:hypothetical protein
MISMAVEGHSAAHAPHEVQRARSMATPSAVSPRAFSGHTEQQVPQAMQRLAIQ